MRYKEGHRSAETRGSEDGPKEAEDSSRKPSHEDEDMFKMEVPYSFKDPSTYQRFSLYSLVYSLSGLVLGTVCIIGGIMLFLNGIVGSTNWTAKVLGVESRISDAAPGAVLFIVGLFIVVVTRFNIRVRK